MDDASPINYFTMSKERVLETYYSLVDQYAMEYRQAAAAEFERWNKQYSSDRYQRNRDHIESRYRAAKEKVDPEKFQHNAIRYGHERIYETNQDLIGALSGIPAKDEYEFLLRKPFDQKLQESLDNLSLYQTHLESAKSIQEDHLSNKPSKWKNLLTGGLAQKVWESKLSALQSATTEAEDRYWAQNDYIISPLANHDAREFAENYVDKYHQEVVKDMLKVKEEEIQSGSVKDPIRTFELEAANFASRYPRYLKEEINKAVEVKRSCEKVMDEHERSKPGIVSNILSLGRERRDWEASLESKVLEFHTASENVRDLEKQLRVNQRELTPDAIAWGKNEVQEQYPNLAEAYHSAVTREWSASNQNRLAQSRERANEPSAARSIER